MRQKLILLIIFMMVSAAGFSLLSDLHYLPPLKQGENNLAVSQQYIYLSNPKTMVFTVNVYKGSSVNILK